MLVARPNLHWPHHAWFNFDRHWAKYHEDNKRTQASATMNVSKFKLTVPLMRSDKLMPLKHIHRALCQIRTLAELEFDQDLLAARPVKWCFKEKHIVTVTTDTQICVASEEKVKHIVYLKMPRSAVRHKVGTQINHAITVLQFSHYPYLSWHSQKETKHPANTYSVRELFQFSSKAESSKPPHHSVGSSGRAVCLRTLTECNSWTNNRTKKNKMDAQQGQPQLHSWEAGWLLPTSRLFKRGKMSTMCLRS